MAKKKDLLPPGTLICPPFYVPGEAIPWKTPTVTRYGTTYKSKELVAWQVQVATAAHKVLAGQAPYDGPVALELYLCRACPKSRQPGDYWDVRPDLDNLQKGIIDAITGKAMKKAPGPDRKPLGETFGRILSDDNRVCESHVHKVFGVADWVGVALMALPERLPAAMPHPAWEIARRPAGIGTTRLQN